MGDNKSTHLLEMRRQRGGLRTANTDGGGQKHALPRDKETKGSLRIANTAEGGQKHTPTRDEQTKGGLSHVGR